MGFLLQAMRAGSEELRRSGAEPRPTGGRARVPRRRCSRRCQHGPGGVELLEHQHSGMTSSGSLATGRRSFKFKFAGAQAPVPSCPAGAAQAPWPAPGFNLV